MKKSARAARQNARTTARAGILRPSPPAIRQPGLCGSYWRATLLRTRRTPRTARTRRHCATAGRYAEAARVRCASSTTRPNIPIWESLWRSSDGRTKRRQHTVRQLRSIRDSHRPTTTWAICCTTAADAEAEAAFRAALAFRQRLRQGLERPWTVAAMPGSAAMRPWKHFARPCNMTPPAPCPLQSRHPPLCAGPQCRSAHRAATGARAGS